MTAETTRSSPQRALLSSGCVMRADAQRNYARLVAAATESFLANGPNASLDEIAKRAGVGSGTLYRHFPSREDLLKAVGDRLTFAVNTVAGPLLVAEDPARALGEWLIELVSSFGSLNTVLQLTGDDREHATAGTLHAASERLIERARQQGAIRADVTAAEVIQLANGVSYACSSASAKSTCVSPERLVELIIDGLRTP